jgi:hypothetical protein
VTTTVPPPRAMHLSESADWGSPPEVIQLARDVLGRIDLDPATSNYWNHHGVRANYIIGALGETMPWAVRGRGTPVTVFLNPPGDKSGQLVKAFWSRLVHEWTCGVVDSAVWVGFSLEQLVTLQSAPINPMTLPMVVPRRRLSFLFRSGHANAPPTQAKAPTHGNYLTLLPSPEPELGRAQLAMWAARGREIGEVRA